MRRWEPASYDRHPRKAPLSGGRLAAVIGGVTSLMLAALLLLAGTGLLWADSRKDDDGYFSTVARAARGHHELRDRDRRPRDRRRADVGEGLYGKLRLEVDGDKPVFAGIARSRDVHAYLRDSAHATLTDLEVRPFRPDYRDEPGTARSRPARRADVLGRLHRGRRRAHADVGRQDGDWSVVVMNADGSRGVNARVSAGASVPLLDDLGYGFSIASLLLVLARRDAARRGASGVGARPSSPDGSASAA